MDSDYQEETAPLLMEHNQNVPVENKSFMKETSALVQRSNDPQEDQYQNDTMIEVKQDTKANSNTISIQKDHDDCQMLSGTDLSLLSFLLFCVHYGFSIEMIFISPFFFKVGTPETIDTIIWFTPPIIAKLIYPFIADQFSLRTPSILRYRKLFILLFIGLSISGLLLIAFSRFITTNWISLYDEKRISTMSMAAIGFILQDIGQEYILILIGKYSEDSISPKDEYNGEFFFSLASSSGKILAFVISSVLAFNSDIWDIQNFMGTLTFSYCLGAILFVIGLCWAFFGIHTDPNLPHQEFSLPEYSLGTILPGIKFLQSMENSQKTLFVSHFLLQGNLLLINIYATLWMGVTMQHNQVRYNINQNKERDYLFDLGISQGALILSVAAILYLISSRLIMQLKSIKSKVWYLSATNFFLNFSFLITYYSENFYSSCASLLLWGIAQSSFDTIFPCLSTHLALTKNNANSTYELLNLSTFFSQTLFWLLMPIIFVLLPNTLDDISFSLLQGSIFGLIGSLFVLAFQY